MSTTPPLFARLVDDAAMFPPGNASAIDAIRAHLSYRDSWLDGFVGPLLVHIEGWAELVGAHGETGRPPLDVVVLGTIDEPSDVPAGINVVGYEMPATPPPLRRPPSGLRVAYEFRADGDGLGMVAAIAAASAAGAAMIGKFRTGGVTAEAFPSEQTLATVLSASVSAGLPMKFTAGLHHAVRHTDAESGFEHHGFLNVMAAIERLLAASPRERVLDVLGERDPEAIAKQVRDWGADETARVRERFVSFGCCGVTDPIDDLVALRLIERETT